MTTTTRLYASLLGPDGKVAANSLGSNSFSNTLIDYFKDVDTIAISPAINNTLLWDGTNWVPGSVVVSSSENANIANIVLGVVNASIVSGFANVARFANIANLANMVVTLSNFTTANLREASSNLYFTNARVDARFLTTSVNNLVDVNTTGASVGQVLLWDGSNWVPNTYVSTTSNFSTQTTFANLAALANVAIIANSALFANVANIANMVATISNFTTANLREASSNLYFTNARVDARIATTSIDLLSDVNTTGVLSGDYLRWNGVFWYPSALIVLAQAADFANVANIANLVVSIRNFSTSNLIEGANLYYTNARVASNVALLSVNVLADVDTTGASFGQALIWNGSNWIAQTIAAPTANIANFANVSNIANLVLSLSNLSTSNLREGSNLYYTNNRVFANVSQMSINVLADVNIVDLDVNDLLVWDGSQWIPQSAAALSNISVNADFSNRSNLANLVLSLSNLTTSNLAEGTNLYYTNNRVFSNVSQMSINVLADVNTTGATINQVLAWNGSNWIPATAAAGTSENANIANLVLTLSNFTTANLREASSNLYFTNARVDARIATTSINALYDVDTTGAAVDHVLSWNGSNWISKVVTAPLSNIALFAEVANIANVVLDISNFSINALSDVDIVNLDVNDILAWDGVAWVPTSAAALSNISVNADFAARANLANVVVTLSNFTTDNLREGSANLYFTNVRSRRTISAGDQTIIYDEGLGTIRANLEYFANANITVSAVSFVDNKKFTFTATSGQTEFSGVDINGETLTVSRPSKVNVFLNGILMSNVVDYTATQSGIFFNYGVSNNDVVTVIDGVLVGYGVDAANVVNVNGYTGIVLLSTTDIPEGTKLYYTNSRVFSNVSQMSINVLADVNTTGVSGGQALIWDGANWVPGSPIIGATAFANTSNIANLVLTLDNLTTSNLAEGTNLYFTNARVLANVSGILAGKASSADLTTSNIRELANLFYTNARVYSNVVNLLQNYSGNVNAGNVIVTGKIFGDGSALTGIASGSSSVANIANLANMVVTLSNFTTSNLAEGSNLYFTNARVAANVSGLIAGKASSADLTTANVIELSNLYYTNTRVYSNVINLLQSYTGNLSAGNITVTGKFYGDGSALTGISSASANLSSMATYNGNILASQVFVTGNVTANGYNLGTTGAFTSTLDNNTIIRAGVYEYTFSDQGYASLGNVRISNISTPLGATMISSSTGNNTRIQAGLFTTTFNDAGNVLVPNLVVSGTIYGDGSGLTGITANLSSLATYNGNILAANINTNTIRASNLTVGNVISLNGCVIVRLTTDNNTYIQTGAYTSVFRDNGNVNLPNVIASGKFYGDGSGLTGVTANLSALATYNGNILAANINATTITTTNLFVSNIITPTGGTALSVTSTQNTTIRAGAYTSQFLDSGNVILPNLTVLGNVVISGKYVGDGSGLTNVNVSTSLSGMASYNGNILASQVFVTGNVTANGYNIGTSGAFTSTTDNNTIIRAGVYEYTFSDQGFASLGNVRVSNIATPLGATMISSSTGNNTRIQSGLFTSTFNDVGNVLVPNLVVSGIIYGDGSGITNIPAAAALAGMATYGGNILAANINTNTIRASNLTVGNVISLNGCVIVRLATDSNTYIQTGAFTSIFRDTGNVIVPNLYSTGNITAGGSINFGSSSAFTSTNDNNTTIRAGIYEYTFSDSGIAILGNVRVSNIQGLSGGTVLSTSTNNNTSIRAGIWESIFRDDGNVNLPNVIASGKFFGDGSGLTNITVSASLSGLPVYNGNILAANITATNINTTNLYVSNIINSTGATVLTVTTTNNTNIRAGAYISQFLDTGNVILPNVIARGTFYGNGAGLTNITVSTSLTGMATYNANILASQVFVTGNVTANGYNIGVSGAFSSTSDNNTIIRAGVYEYTFSDQGYASLGNVRVSNVATPLGAVMIASSSGNNTTVRAGVFTSTFNDSGNVVFPNVVVTSNLFLGSSSATSISSTNDNNTTIRAGTNSYEFADSGTATFPSLKLTGNLLGSSGGTVIQQSTTNNTTIRAGSCNYVFTDIGFFGVNTTNPTEHVHIVGNLFVTQGIYITSDGNTNPYISNFSSGSGSRTTYIGNQSITTSSDIRLKNNIANTSLNALNVVSNLRVVDFTWNDPSDKSFNNKNVRGVWTGLIAQEVINQVPYVVNAVRDEQTLLPIENSDSYWTLEYDKLVPILIKAIQELKKEFDEYKESHP